MSEQDLSYPLARDMDHITALHLMTIPEAAPLWAWVYVKSLTLKITPATAEQTKTT